MKSQVIDVASISIQGKKVLFDANIWIIINGFCGESSGPRLDAYSAAYKELLVRNNTVVINDYVLGEFTNRCARFEHSLAEEEDSSVGSFKSYRQSAEFRPTMESIRDTCLNLIEDCEFIRVGRTDFDIKHAINEFCSGKLDFSDVILSQHCLGSDLYLMTDDFDFCNCGLRLITANRRLIRYSKER